MMLDKFGLVATNIKAVKVGEIYGWLLIEAVGQIQGTYRYYAVCRCSCGSNPKRIRVDGLISGAVVSCGCIHKERTSTHGMTSNGHYNRWLAMIERCYNEKCKAYKNYGGRGISVCEDWHDVARYVKDLPDGYADGLEIDRIDNNGNYEPGNIRWATRKTNCINRRSTRMIEFNGEEKTLTDWAASIGLSISSLSDRLDRWSVEDALTKPKGTRVYSWWDDHEKPPEKPKKETRFYWYNGSQNTMKALSEMSGVSSKLLRKRINERKWSVARAVETKL